MTRRMIYMLLAVLALIAALAFGFYLHIQKLIASSPKPGPQTVSTTKAQLLDWQPQLNAVASLSPVRGVDLSSEIAGLVRQVSFHSGQNVKAGEVLVELNADVERAQMRTLEAAVDLAELVLARDKAQLAAQAVSQAQVDADTADLKSKRAQLAQAQATLDKKTVRAPFAGRLGISTVVPGQYLNVGDKIVTLQTLQPIYADFSLPQQRLSQLSVSQRVQLRTDAYPGQTFAGRINAISPKVDTGTRNVQVQATLDNPQAKLLPGMFGNLGVNVGEPMRTLTLPQAAITYNPYGATVFVIKPAEKAGPDGKKPLQASQVFVTTGETRGDQVAVTKGLQAGDEVVTSGQLKLKNGTPVLIDNSVQPLSQADPKPQEH